MLPHVSPPEGTMTKVLPGTWFVCLSEVPAQNQTAGCCTQQTMCSISRGADLELPQLSNPKCQKEPGWPSLAMAPPSFLPVTFSQS
jgi:hypothetical protein